jgi:hypothetical protein
LTNGVLLSLCAGHGFDVLMTIDKKLMVQQNRDKNPVTTIVINALSSKVEELVLFLPSFEPQVNRLEKHKAYLIEKWAFYRDYKSFRGLWL